MTGLIAVLVAAGVAGQLVPPPAPPRLGLEHGAPWHIIPRTAVDCRPDGLPAAVRFALDALRFDPVERSMVMHGVPWRIPAGHFALEAAFFLRDLVATAETAEILDIDCRSGRRAVLHIHCAEPCMEVNFDVPAAREAGRKPKLSTRDVSYVFASRSAAEEALEAAQSAIGEEGTE